MKKMVKGLSLLVALCLMISVLAACGGGSAQQTATPSPAGTQGTTSAEVTPAPAPELKKVDIKVLTGGDTANIPKTEEVCAAISKDTEKELNINLSVVTIPWAESAEKIKTMAAAGEKFDIFISYAGEFAGNIARKQCIPLNELLDNYGTDIKNIISPEDFKDLTVDGTIYGVPAIYPSTDNIQDGVIIRKDLRLKYNVPEIRDLTTFEQYLDAIVTNEKGMAPIYGRGGRFGLPYAFTDKTEWNFGTDAYSLVRIEDVTAQPYKVKAVVDTDGFKALAAWCKKAYDKGWMAKETLTTKDDMPLFLAGKCAVLNYDIWNLNTVPAQIKQNVPGAEVEFVRFREGRPIIKNGMVNNYAMISATSENPDRAMMFLNWIRMSKDNYNYYILGRKGIDWEPVGEDQFKYLEPDVSNQYRPTPWWTKQMQYDLFDVNTDPAFLAEYKKAATVKYTNSPLIGFNVDMSNIKKEVAQCNTVTLEKVYPLLAGVKGTEADIKAASDALQKAGMQKIIDEVQKQVDEFMAKKGK